MTDKTESLIREVARLVGSEVAKTSQFAVDRTQDLTLMLLQRAAANSMGNTRREDALAKTSTAVSLFTRVSLIVPFVAGRVAASTTYLGLRVGVEVASRARKFVS